jgi:hypothetical protein
MSIRQVAYVVINSAVALVITLSTWFFGRNLDRRTFRDFGFRFNQRWWEDLGFGLALGGALMGLIFLIEWGAGWVEITDVLASRTGGFSFLPGFLIAFIHYLGVGISEEVWNRGYLLTNLAEGFHGKRLGASGAILLAALIQALIFGVLHALNPNASLTSTFNLFLAGIFLGLGYLLTGEMALPIGLHITWNFFQGNVFGFPVSGGGNDIVSLIQIQQAGPDLWTGGAFGPEAGLLGLGAMILGSGLIVLWVRLREGDVKLEGNLAVYANEASRSMDDD